MDNPFFSAISNNSSKFILMRFTLFNFFSISQFLLLTGSSSKLLPKEISTELRGRTLSYLLLPFSFSEFLGAKDFKPETEIFEKRGTLLKFLRTYLKEGGFPEVVLSENKEKILNFTTVSSIGLRKSSKGLKWQPTA